MKMIWKFPLNVVGEVQVLMPVGAEILTLQLQYGVPTMWVLVDPSANYENRNFVIYGTGHTICEPENRSYVGTYQLPEEGLVFHLFEIKE